MFKLIRITPFSDIKYLKEILFLLLKNKSLIFFNEYENVENNFWKNLYSKHVMIIAAVENNSIFAVCMLEKFEKVSINKFICCISGASERGNAKKLEVAFNYIFSDLKEKGCIAVRIETLTSNRATRNMANRLGFKKIGTIEAAGIRKNKMLSSILYEKIL